MQPVNMFNYQNPYYQYQRQPYPAQMPQQYVSYPQVMQPVARPVYPIYIPRPVQPTIIPRDTYQPVYRSDGTIDMDATDKKYRPDLFDDERKIENEKEFNATLYKNGRFLQLAKYGYYGNRENIYNKIKDNNDFKELINSKYFADAEGFLKLLATMEELEGKRADAVKIKSIALIDPPPPDFSSLDIPDYLRLLNNFTKSNASDDLKRYYIITQSSELSPYYTRLNKINSSTDIVKTLTELYHFT